ncbi:MAG: nucleotidyl transferase AbiEii/AbiGii toxin family protein, partial [Nanoarchaeota archaeon]
MVKIIEILEEFLQEIEKNNPHKLIAKGGTALSLFYLNHHRESEDLDFDAMLDKSQHKNIEFYFLSILEHLKKKGILTDYRKGKSGLASTNRYHINLVLETHKEFYTKIDVDFVKPIKNIKKKGDLFYYPLERLFIGKCITFINRKEFKDIYDIKHMLPKIDLETFRNNPNVVKLIDDLIKAIQSEDMPSLYKSAFRNVDLR